MNVEQACYADIASLGGALGDKEFFVDRFERQKNSRGVLFIAWLDGKPVRVLPPPA